MEKAKILVIEDDLAFGTMIQTWLRKKGFTAEKVSTVGAAETHILEEALPDLILSDLRLPDHDGLYLLDKLRKQGISTPFIVMTSYAEVQNAVLAMKSGATDYVAKPFHPDILLQKINDALPHSTTSSPVKDRKQQYIEGNSEASRQLYEYVSLVAPTPMSVLILGASGTGKEYVARRIHQLSERSKGPFYALDCGAIPREVAASEFVGYKRGAFTGADTNKQGAFEVANGGTLVLDEIGNLGYDVQVQLLRALQERHIRPLGSTTEIPVDIRLVCATNENLAERVANGEFREDLYHRINEFTLYMPALKDRGSDIFLLADLFLQQANNELRRNVLGFDDKASELLASYSWPGNLRELGNVIKRATLLSRGKYIGVKELQLTMNPVARPTLALHDEQTERERIEAALRSTNGNKTQAAQLLGVDRKTLYNKIQKYHL